MRSEAYKISGFTIVISALGFLLRWLQDMRIQNEETGLAAYAPISFLVAGVIAAAAVILAVLAMRLRQFDAPAAYDRAYEGHTPFYGAVGLIPAILLAAAGLLRLVRPGDVLWVTTHRICGGFTVLGALGAGVVVSNDTKPEGASACRKGAAMMMLFAGFWLVTGYRDAAGDPVVWRFVVGILARCMALLAVYHAAGWFYNSPHPYWTVFSCHFGAFLCVMSAIDQGSMADSVTYAAVAMQLLIWGFVAVENLKTKPLDMSQAPAEE